MKGLLHYLSIVCPEFNRQTMSADMISDYLKKRGANFKEVTSVQLIAEVDKLEKNGDILPEEAQKAREDAAKFVSHLRFEIDPENGGKPTIIFNPKADDAKRHFGLGHEWGHLALHSFLKDRLSEDMARQTESVMQILYGILEIEADYFANLLLIPDAMLERFVEEARTIIKDGDRGKLLDLKRKIYKFCVANTKRLLKLEEISPRAEVAIRLRILRFLWSIEEEMIIQSKHFDFSDLDLAEDVAVNPYTHYIEIKKLSR